MISEGVEIIVENITYIDVYVTNKRKQFCNWIQFEIVNVIN